MPRKSAASLSVVAPLVPKASAPKELTAEQAAVWDSVVATKPAEWFTRDTEPLLVAYCRMTVNARTIGKQIDKFDLALLDTADGFDHYEKLTRLQLGMAEKLASLATKMRICQQSRFTTERAGTMARKAAQADAPLKPWERSVAR